MEFIKFIKWQWNEIPVYNRRLFLFIGWLLISAIAIIIIPSTVTVLVALGSIALSGLILICREGYQIINSRWKTYKLYVNHEEEQVVRALKNEIVRSNPYTRHKRSMTID